MNLNIHVFLCRLDRSQPPSNPSKPCSCQPQASKCSYAFDNLAYGSFVNLKQ